MAKKAVKKQSKGNNCCGSLMGMAGKCGCDDGCSFGRILFVVGVYMILNTLGLLAGIPTWVTVMTGIGFVLMRF